MSRVSFIIAAYQAQATLRRAVESALGQTYRNFDVWVADDGSTDGTAELADQLAREDARVRVLHLRPNVGAAAAMNAAIRASAAEYLAILDADDVAVPERLDVQVAYLDAHPEVHVLGGAAYFVDEAGVCLRVEQLPKEHEELRSARWHRSPFVHPTVMMRRSFFEATGGYTAGLRLGEDYDHWMRGFLYPNFRYANLALPLVHYRAKAVQRWTMIQASARVRRLAGVREGRRVRGWLASTRILAEGALEQTGVFAWRNRKWAKALPEGGSR